MSTVLLQLALGSSAGSCGGAGTWMIVSAPTTGNRRSVICVTVGWRAGDGRRGATRQAPGRRGSSTRVPASTTSSIRGRSRSSARSSAATTARPTRIVMGSGRIDGRPVMVAAEDFTVKAGTISQASNSKRYRVAEIARRRPGAARDDARRRGLPRRRAGARVARPPTSSPRRSCSGRVPLITAVLGARPATARWSRRCRTSR